MNGNPCSTKTAFISTMRFLIDGCRSQVVTESSHARIATRAVSKPWDYRRSLEEVVTGQGPAVYSKTFLDWLIDGVSSAVWANGEYNTGSLCMSVLWRFGWHPRSGGSATFAKSLQSNAQATKLQMAQAYPNAQRLKLKSEICFSVIVHVVLVCTRTLGHLTTILVSADEKEVVST